MRAPRLLIRCARVAERLRRRRSGNVAMIVALMLPVLLLLVGGAIDFSAAIEAKSKLQDALDAAGLAVSVEVAENPNEAEASLQTLAQNQLLANDFGRSPTISSFHVCAPVQNDCTASGGTLPANTVTIGASDLQPCAFAAILPFVCTATGRSVALNASTRTTIGFGKTLQLNIVMDSSASMIVGATQNDVNLITTWVSANWSQVKPGDPPPYSGDNPPCAFACHDVGNSTTQADVQMGLTNAHAASTATYTVQTRFDVMISAAQQLITHIQTEVQSNPILKNNTYMFNVMSFDTTLHSWGTANTTSFSAAQSAVALVSAGPGHPHGHRAELAHHHRRHGRQRLRRLDAVEVPDPGHRRAAVGPHPELFLLHARV